MCATGQRIGDFSLAFLDRASPCVDYDRSPVSGVTLLSRRKRKVVNVKIEKFIDGKRATSFSVPVAVLRIAGAVLPGAALGSLARRGLNVRQLLEAKRTGASYTTTMSVRERGVWTEVVVSLK
jgi:hypothetical protein